MKKTKNYNRTLILLGGMLVAMTVNSNAQTASLTIQNYSSLDLTQVAGTVNGTAMEEAYIGIYSFAVSGVSGINGLANGSTLSSICLGPLGNLETGTYGYTLESFAQANPGLNPGTWAQGTGANAGQLWGIQNANYLWSQLGTTATSPTSAAALAMAMYDALYNSTGYGATPYTGTGFAPNFYIDGATVGAGMFDAAEGTAYTNDLALLKNYTGNPLSPGYIFVPNDPNAGGPSGQSFIVLDSLATPVPESATIVAASLLLLPLGASTLRILRRKETGVR